MGWLGLSPCPAAMPTMATWQSPSTRRNTTWSKIVLQWVFWHLCVPLNLDIHTMNLVTGEDEKTAWWLGGADWFNEGEWRWNSGQAFSFTNWKEGEPNDSGNEVYNLFIVFNFWPNFFLGLCKHEQSGGLPVGGPRLQHCLSQRHPALCRLWEVSFVRKQKILFLQTIFKD